MGLGKSSRVATPQVVYVEDTASQAEQPKPTVTSAVARSISAGAEAQVEAQNQARQRSSGIISTFRRYAGTSAAATNDTKQKLGQ